jgi:hypothetical protein
MPEIAKYELEKAVWKSADFDVMGWHDATIWSIALVGDQFELLFDIDYIFQWVDPVPPEQYFSFWVSPATLVFEGVQNIVVDIEINYIQQIEVAEINREGPITSADGDLSNWKWVVELQQGRIQFEADGFTQYIRKAPIYGSSQVLDIAQRGGISFDRICRG